MGCIYHLMILSADLDIKSTKICISLIEISLYLRSDGKKMN